MSDMVTRDPTGDQHTLATLELLVEARKRMVDKMPLSREAHILTGRQQLQERLSALLGAAHAEDAALDLREAVAVVVSALAHFAAADGRSWR